MILSQTFATTKSFVVNNKVQVLGGIALVVVGGAVMWYICEVKKTVMFNTKTSDKLLELVDKASCRASDAKPNLDELTVMFKKLSRKNLKKDSNAEYLINRIGLVIITAMQIMDFRSKGISVPDLIMAQHDNTIDEIKCKISQVKAEKEMNKRWYKPW